MVASTSLGSSLMLVLSGDVTNVTCLINDNGYQGTCSAPPLSLGYLTVRLEFWSGRGVIVVGVR